MKYSGTLEPRYSCLDLWKTRAPHPVLAKNQKDGFPPIRPESGRNMESTCGSEAGFLWAIFALFTAVNAAAIILIDAYFG